MKRIDEKIKSEDISTQSAKSVSMQPDETVEQESRLVKVSFPVIRDSNEIWTMDELKKWEEDDELFV